MRVLYFHQHYSTPDGSCGIRSYEMARRLVARGHEVTMVCGSYAGAQTGLAQPFVRGRREGLAHGIRVIEFDLSYANSDGFLRRSATFLRFALRSCSVALTENYDVIFATTTPLTAGLPGIAARWLRGKRFVFEVRDLWPELPREMKVITNPFVLAAMGILEWTAYKSAHRLIALSPGIAAGIARHSIPVENIRVVPNGCDLELFAHAPAPWRPASIPEDSFVAVFSGTHGRANGLDAVLDAAAVLAARGRKDIALLLVGQGECKAQLVRRARDEGLDNVYFHDPVQKVALPDLLAGCDLGMQILANIPAFYYGTSPNKFFDYIAAGLPVLTNYPGWIADMITSAQAGWTVEPESPRAMADALQAAADDRSTLAERAGNTGRLAQSQFARGKLADEWVDWVCDEQRQPHASTARSERPASRH